MCIFIDVQDTDFTLSAHRSTFGNGNRLLPQNVIQVWLFCILMDNLNLGSSSSCDNNMLGKLIKSHIFLNILVL